jgi:predicted AlkP superfamily pyrophosphatase or phosphodiesterase
MSQPLILLSIPGLREKDVDVMANLRRLMAGGEIAELTPSFPCVTCSVQAAMTTGKRSSEHGIVGNGIYWREKKLVEMWTAPNECVEQPQIWDLLTHHEKQLTSAVWFPMHSKGCEADFICTPAPIHNPDGSESLWCYTRPLELYGELRDKLGHFPLKHYWGPIANVQGSQWIADSAALAAERWQPDFFYIYLPHLDYAAQRAGPESAAADTAVEELDGVIGRLAEQMAKAYLEPPVWLAAGEYAIGKVDHVEFPNRVLREAGLLAVKEDEAGGELIDFERSRAFAMADHQFSHVFVEGGDEVTIQQVAELFRGRHGIDEVLVGAERNRYALDHSRSGEVILISKPHSWQAYYYWLDDAKAPGFARTVDIHRKPGYDPVELFFDPATRSIPLNAHLVKGSHGAPAIENSQRTVLLASSPTMFPHKSLDDIDVFDVVMNHFGITMR